MNGNDVLADLNFVEIAGGFFAIARNEGDGAALIEKLDSGDEAVQRDLEELGDVEENFRDEGLCFRHSE